MPVFCEILSDLYLFIVLSDLYVLNSFVDISRGSSYIRIQFLPDGSLFVLIITNKFVINKQIKILFTIDYTFFNLKSIIRSYRFPQKGVRSSHHFTLSEK